MMPALRHRIFLYLQCAFSAIGLFPVAQGLAGHFAGILPRFQVTLYPQVEPFFYPEKRDQILGYLLFLVLVGSCALGAWLFAQRSAEDRPAGRHHVLLLALTAVAAVAAWFLPPMWRCIVWVCTSSVPLWAVELSTVRCLAHRRFDLGLAAASTLSLLAMTLPFCVEAPRIESEFLNVPTETELRGVGPVSTGSYLLNDAFMGMTMSDPQTSDKQRYARFPSVTLTMTPELQEVIDESRQRNDAALIDAIQHGMDPLEATGLDGKKRIHLENLAYEDGQLIATDAITRDQEGSLASAALEPERARIAELALASRRYDAVLHGHAYTPQEKRFLLENQHQITTQILARRIIHHQYFMLGPIQELELGRPAGNVNSQYGYFMAALLQKILHLLGGVTYQAYVHLTYAFIPLYVLSAAALYWRICSNAMFAALLLSLSVAAFGMTGYDVMATAPGMNPLRHGLDMVAICLAFEHLRLRRGAPLVAAYACGFAAILLNTQCGLSLVLAMAAAFGVRSMLEGAGAGRLPLRDFAAACAGVALATWHPAGKDELSSYYFDGLCGFPTQPAVVILFIMLNVGVMLLLQLRGRSMAPHERYGLMLMTFYSQLMFIYYIWGGSRFHLLNFCAIYAMTTLYLVQLAIAHVDWVALRRTAVVGSLKIISVALTLAATANFAWQECAYRSIFTSHRAYAWELPKARIITTMPEQPFAEAASLIDRYAPEPGIAILSEYDNFLPFLADRYSDLPYPDLQWFVMSELEKRRVIDQLRRDHPRFLFADRDLMRELSYEVISCHVPLIGSLQAESILRVRRLRVIQDIFRALIADYRLVDSAGLLSVWERRDAPEREFTPDH